MARAIAARHQGDDYQSRLFWFQVCRLFLERSKLRSVVYEAQNVKSLDDVVVEYADNGIRNAHGETIRKDFYQAKFHVTAAGAVTGEGLVDPAFVNASSVSLLERLLVAQRLHAPDGKGCRFILYSPWAIDSNDALAELHRMRDGSLDVDKLLAAGKRSKLGVMLKSWVEKLGLEKDAEIRALLTPLRILTGPTLEDLGDRLNDKLRLAGLAPVDDTQIIHPYDDLTRKLLVADRVTLDRGTAEDVCKQAGLWIGSSVLEPDAHRIGIRSFSRWSEHLEDETDAMIDISEHFNGRYIVDPTFWNGRISVAVATFLENAMQDGSRPYHLNLQAHSSFAFLAGHCLDSKSSRTISLVQSTRGRRAVWRLTCAAAPSTVSTWTFTSETVAEGSGDVALIVSATHDVLNDARTYVRTSLPNVGRMLICRMSCGPGPACVQSEGHAVMLAETLAQHLRTARYDNERSGVLHVFAAVPNALMFCIGQQSRGFGRCILYEYDFESNKAGAYTPSFALPLIERAGCER